MSEETDVYKDFGTAVSQLANAMMRLDPGGLARLRRMDIEGPGALDFWQLVRDFPFGTDTKRMQFVRLLAELVPRGEVSGRAKFYDFQTPLGKALALAGYSEARLARFIALPFERRGEGLEGLVKFLSSSSKAPDSINCAELGGLLFWADVRQLRRLAKTYYANFLTKNDNQAQGKTQ